MQRPVFEVASREATAGSITPADIASAIAHDEELSDLFRKCEILGGGPLAPLAEYALPAAREDPLGEGCSDSSDGCGRGRACLTMYVMTAALCVSFFVP